MPFTRSAAAWRYSPTAVFADGDAMLRAAAFDSAFSPLRATPSPPFAWLMLTLIRLLLLADATPHQRSADAAFHAR